MKTSKIRLEELTCPSCIKKIESLLSKTQGVMQVQVLFNSSKVKVSFDEEVISEKEIATKIEKLGYKVLNQILA